MKRLFTVLFTALMLTAVLCVGASASDFDAAAQELSAIGMFRGDGSGFALDRAPTRSEAAIMLVRLYGAEEKAKTQYEAGEISHPFTDVSDTAAPYAAWLKANGIANGISETAFGSARPCTAQNYVVFLLRALGYQDGKDFQYDGALEFAAGKGLFDTSMFSGTFLRDDLAAVTYQALACNLKDGSTYLLDSLVKSGAIDAKAAEPITKKIEAYRALMKASGDLGSSMDVDVSAKFQMDMSASGTSDGEKVNETVSMPMDLTGKIQMAMLEKPQMAVTMKGKAMEEQVEIGMWLKDGWLYAKQGETSYKMDVSGSMDTFLDTYRQLLDAGSVQLNGVMLPFTDTITSASSGGNTVYTLKLNGAASSLISDVLDLMPESVLGAGTGLDDLSLRLDSCTYTYTLDASGALKSAAAAMKMGMDVSETADPQNTLQVKLDMDMNMEMTFNAFGDAVKVTFPADLASFPQMIGGADEPAFNA